MLIVYHAQDFAEAHILAGMLKAQGIDAHVAGHYLQGALGEVGTFNLAQVLVGNEDFLEARILVEEYERNSQDEGQYGS